MSTISSISGSSTLSMMQGMRRPHGGGERVAEALFSQLDTSNQGYIDKSTLQAAFEQLSTSSSSSSSSSTSSTSTNVDALFSKLDTNGDGKITKDEFTSTLQQLESQLQANAKLQSGGMPPPPPQDGDSDDAGFTKEQLTAQLGEIGSSDSKRSGVISDVINNFDKADANGDGKVSAQEAMAYEQSKSSASTSSTSTSDSSSSSTSTDTSAKVLQQIMQLLQAYNTDNNSNSGSSLSLMA